MSLPVYVIVELEFTWHPSFIYPSNGIKINKTKSKSVQIEKILE